MAYGAAQVAVTDIGASTTGIAGPTSGTEEKPVGLAFVCVYYKGIYKINKILATGSREIIRDRVATSALDLIRSCVEE